MHFLNHNTSTCTKRPFLISRILINYHIFIRRVRWAVERTLRMSCYRARPEQEAEKGCQVLSPLFRSIDVKPVYD